MIIATWKDTCWELKSIIRRGKAPKIILRNMFVANTIEDAIKEVVIRRRQKVCKAEMK